MGVVGSLPSLPPPSLSTDNIKVLYEESVLSNDDCSYCVMTMNETDSTTNSPVNSSTDDQNQSTSDEHRKEGDCVTVAYGPITIRVRQSKPPTLATGRRSKFLQLEGDAAAKRDLRRKRNRDAAKKLKEKRFIIEQQLQKDIDELESKGQALESRIKVLETHKDELDRQYKYVLGIREKITKTTSSTLKHIEYSRPQLHQSVPIHRNGTTVKEEPRSPSPQWQILFRI